MKETRYTLGIFVRNHSG